MSYDAVQWAIRLKLAGSPKLTLIVMADLAHSDTGEIFPSMSTLAEMTGQNIKTARANVHRLVELGFLIDTGRRVGGTAQIPVYRCNLDAGGKRLPKSAPKAPDFTAEGCRNRESDHNKKDHKKDTSPLTPQGEKGDCDFNLFGEPIVETKFEDAVADHFFEQWNQLAAQFPALPAIATMPGHRRSALLARLDENGAATIADARRIIDTLIERVRGSPFLCGEVKAWAAGPDWVLGPKNFPKTMERRNERDLNGNVAAHDRPGGKSVADAGRAALEVLRSRGTRPGGRGSRAPAQAPALADLRR